MTLVPLAYDHEHTLAPLSLSPDTETAGSGGLHNPGLGGTHIGLFHYASNVV